ncbi:MAG: CinA family protein [Ruminococcaceae bacterium]|nr:CinA family protein [Oscillospiraceae bacterium]
MKDEIALAGRLVREFTQKGLTISTAESCTGGLIAKLITDIPGSSAVLKGGCVSYTEEIKHRVLGVSEEILRTKTAVSEECAKAMAEGVRALFRTDIAVSATGYAGPGGGSEKDPVGTVYLGLATAEKTVCMRIFLPDATREKVREEAAKNAIEMALNA